MTLITHRFQIRLKFFLSCLFLTCATPLLSSELKTLAEYPYSAQLWLGHVKAELAPAQNAEFRSKGTGYIQLYLNDGDRITQGDVFAIFQAERINMQKEALENEKILHDVKLQSLDLDHEEKSIMLQGNTDELEVKLNELTVASDLDSVKKNKKLSQRIAEATIQLKKQIERSKKRIELHDDELNYHTERKQLELVIKRKEREFLITKKTAEYQAPFDGIFRITLPKNSADKEIDKTKIWLAGGVIFAEITNQAQYNVRVLTSSTIISQNATESLTIQIPLHGAGICHARYIKTDTQGQRRTKVLVFQVIDEDRQLAKKIAKSNPQAQIYRELPDKCHIVAKKDLISETIGTHVEGGWEAIVKRIWPQAKIIAVGHRDLAIQAAQ